jgi:hypothetical protein
LTSPLVLLSAVLLSALDAMTLVFLGDGSGKLAFTDKSGIAAHNGS